jgi:hypothetical protein
VRKVRRYFTTLLGLLWFTFWGARVGLRGPKNKGMCINILLPCKLLMYVYMCMCVFYYEAVGTAATPGLLCQPRVIMKMIVESMMECRLAGETEVVGENLPQRHFCPSQNPTYPTGFEPAPPRWEAGD